MDENEKSAHQQLEERVAALEAHVGIGDETDAPAPEAEPFQPIGGADETAEPPIPNEETN